MMDFPRHSEPHPHAHPREVFELAPELTERLRQQALVAIAAAESPLTMRETIETATEPLSEANRPPYDAARGVVERLMEAGYVARRDKWNHYLPTPQGIEVARTDSAYRQAEQETVDAIRAYLTPDQRPRLTPRGLILYDAGAGRKVGVKVEGGKAGLRALSELDLTEVEAARIIDTGGRFGSVREVERTYALDQPDSTDLTEVISIDYPGSNRIPNERRLAKLPVPDVHVDITHRPVRLGRMRQIAAELSVVPPHGPKHR